MPLLTPDGHKNDGSGIQRVPPLNWKVLSILAFIGFAAAMYWAVSPAFRSHSTNNEKSERRSTMPIGTPGPNDPILVGAGRSARATAHFGSDTNSSHPDAK